MERVSLHWQQGLPSLHHRKCREEDGKCSEGGDGDGDVGLDDVDGAGVLGEAEEHVEPRPAGCGPVRLLHGPEDRSDHQAGRQAVVPQYPGE